MTIEKACKNCEHMAEAGDGSYECRESPPIGLQALGKHPITGQPGHANISFWPPTQPNKWCGKFMSRRSPTLDS